jgi:hypothetical protein
MGRKETTKKSQLKVIHEPEESERRINDYVLTNLTQWPESVSELYRPSVSEVSANVCG